MADPWIKHKFYFPPANKQFIVAGGDAALSVDEALALFSPLGPYPGQQEHMATEQDGLLLSGGDPETSARSELAQLPAWRARSRPSPFHMRR